MRRKLLIITQVVTLVSALVLGGATLGMAVPGGPSEVGASSSLSVEARVPLAPLTPAGSGFSYQGSLKSGGNPANGDHDFQFSLYDAFSGGNLLGGPIARSTVTVTNGLFSVSLDFGADVFDGNARYLEISVRPSGGGSYAMLSPRQEISPVPYALFALKTQPYKNVVAVAQSGGQFTSIQAALDSITDASAANRYLVRVAPGVYTERVTMKQYVDIEGSGENITTITFAGSASLSVGTVVGASNAELRSLTVQNTGGGALAVAISVAGNSRLTHVTATASGASTTNVGIYVGGSSPSINAVTVLAIGAATESIGVFNEGASPSIVSSNISASGASITQGLFSRTSGTVTIQNSKITAPTPIFLYAGVTVRVGASQLAGGPVSNAGTLVCSASYDGNNKRLGAQCTPDTNVIYVAPSGGDFTSIQAALNSITDASATNRYVVRVAPGTYTEQVTMKQYVDIEGSGENTTRIIWTGSSGPNTGTVVGANNAELRSLTVENTGGTSFAYAIGIYNNGASPSLLNVTVSATGGSDGNYGIYNISSSPNMADVTASVSGASFLNRGVFNISSSPTMTNVTTSASGARNNNGVYNGSGSSPVMTGVTATASSSGASDSNTGVVNNASSPNMINVTATASGGYFTFGVNNNNSSSPNMTDVTASASGASFSNYGVYNDSASPKIMTSVIKASGGATTYGIATYSGGTVTIDNSKVTASTSTISSNSGTATRVGASQLSGGLISGSVTCAGVYDENYTFFASTCP